MSQIQIRPSRFKTVFLFLLGWTLFVTASFASFAPEEKNQFLCRTLLGGEPAVVEVAPLENKRSWAEIKSFRIMTFNVENLFWRVGKFGFTEDGEFVLMSDAGAPAPKPEEKLSRIRALILEESPDIAVIQEVENLEALTDLSQKELKGIYQPFLLKGNDTRGIEIGFLIKRDLPLFVQHFTNKDEQFEENHEVFAGKKIFSRDLPLMVLRKSETDNPFMLVFGNHAKSKRSRSKDPESTILRTAQYEKTALIIKAFLDKYGHNIPALLVGDFNTDVRTAPELDNIREFMTSAFDLAEDKTQEHERITHSYHPKDLPPVYSQMDDVWVSEAGSSLILSAHVIPFKDEVGNIIPPAQSYEERETHPSDHRPVTIEMKLP